VNVGTVPTVPHEQHSGDDSHGGLLEEVKQYSYVWHSSLYVK
jgi:hypothetical protein